MRVGVGALLAIAPALAATRILPEHDQASAPGETDQLRRTGESGNIYRAEFNVPCAKCGAGLGERDERGDDLVFGIDVPRSEKNCGDGNVTVNGQYFFQGTKDLASTGRAVIYSTGRNSGVEHVLDAEWESSCLHTSDEDDRGQFLSFVIKSLDGQPVPNGHGFSASFVQFPGPKVFRVEPEILAKPDAGAATAWLKPPSSSEGAPGSEAATEPGSSFEDDLQELRRLQAQSRALKASVRAQKRVFWKHVTNEFAAVHEEMMRCRSLGCVLDSALRGAHGAVKMMRLRWASGEHHRHHHRPEQKHVADKAVWWHRLWPPTSDAALMKMFMGKDQPSNHTEDTPHDASKEVVSASGGNRTRPWHDRDRMVASNPSGHEQHRQLLLLALVALQILACVFIPMCLLIFTYRRCSRACRADRRWQRESRHRANLVRRAYRKQAMRSWWKRLWREPRMTGYEEKRALVVEQERILECAMQEEIRQLRTAAEAVSTMVNGNSSSNDLESNRGTVMPTAPRNPSTLYHHYHQAHAQHAPPLPPPPAPATYSHIPSAPGRRGSLPDYRSEASYGDPPPTYDASNEADAEADAQFGAVVDGFQYDSALGSSYASHRDVVVVPDWTPDSSVVATSVHGEVSSDDSDDDVDVSSP